VKSGDPGKYRRANTSIEAAVNRHNSYVKLKTPRKKG
jgi:hypothetical protein